MIQRKNLIILAADKDIEYAVKGLLSRTESLGVTPITADIYVHPNRDSGCLRQSTAFLRAYAGQYDHAMVLFDREGCGQETRTRPELEAGLEESLSQNGWEDRAGVVILDPEIEIWVWSDSPQVDRALGWEGQPLNLRDWLIERGFLASGQLKPMAPKEAMRHALHKVRKAASPAIFHQLARNVGLDRCTDPSFLKFRSLLTQWFPSNS
ncbi:MAG: hypothetical protein SF339_21110 [Blastocatellia bacterium]|nr:hypothetical protein [Blastocatellia bacterium]